MIKNLLEENNIEKAYELFREMHPHDRALVFVELTRFERERLYTKITDDELSETLAYLEPEQSAEILTDFDLTKQKYLVEHMEIDDAADLIDELSDSDQDALFEVLDIEDDIKALLSYSEDESGSLMTSNFIGVNENDSVKTAMKSLIDRAPEAESINNLFVTNEEGFVGVVSLNRIIKAKTQSFIGELIEAIPTILDTDDIDQAVHIMRQYGLYELPVINISNQLLGIITLDDAIEAYSEESTEDFIKLAGVSNIDEKSITKSAIHRLPWLVILLAASIPIAYASTMFEEVILAFAILVLFQPLILDAAGDVATQTLAVTLRKLNQTDGASIKDGVSEVITGVINGLILGLTSAIITYFLAKGLAMGNPFKTSLTVGLSLWITVIFGPILGFGIPVILNKFKIDPAVASGPFITTLVDLISLVVYFGLATIFLLGGA